MARFASSRARARIASDLSPLATFEIADGDDARRVMPRCMRDFGEQFGFSGLGHSKGSAISG